MSTRTHERWRNLALDAMGAAVEEVSLHDAQPDSSGSDEASGDGYERRSISWQDADGAELTTDDPITFDAPGEFTVRWVGFWGEENQWLGALRLSTEESFGAPGVYELESATLDMHNQTENGNGND